MNPRTGSLTTPSPRWRTQGSARSCGTAKRSVVLRAFFSEFLHAPLHVGSICPSSWRLASALVRSVPLEGDGIIVDLGAGSGIVTEALLRVGLPPERILAVEKSAGFAGIFARRCPGVSLVIGDARELCSQLMLHRPRRQVAGVISSLPLRTIPDHIVTQIMAELLHVLQPGGFFVQYTYAWWMRYALRKYGLTPCSSEIVLQNIPPAKVELYTAH